jgi:hypothetical protein
MYFERVDGQPMVLSGVFTLEVRAVHLDETGGRVLCYAVLLDESGSARGHVLCIFARFECEALDRLPSRADRMQVVIAPTEPRSASGLLAVA